MTPERLAERLAGRFPDVLVARGEIAVTIDRDALVETLRYLRDEPDLAFDFLSDLSCTDWPGREPRIWMAYHLASPLDQGHRIRVKAGLPGGDLRIATATEVHPSAGWHEREVYDFFGVIFDGHPDLRRIELPEEWVGHPLRKDEPLGGVATQYKGAYVPPPDQREL